MKKNALAALVTINTAGLVAVVGALALRGESGGPTASPATGADARVAALEERVARLEAQAKSTGFGAETLEEAPSTPSALAAPETPPSAGEGEEATPAAAPSDAPVRQSELAALLDAHIERREAAQREAWKAAARPKRSLKDVAAELALDPRQETTIRTLYRGIERDSMKILFEVDEAGLESLKAQLGQAAHDPRLKEQLRERIAVNWTRRQSEIGVLWVKLDARLREELGQDLLKRYYRFDVQVEDREFPDIKEMFFPDPKPDEAGD